MRREKWENVLSNNDLFHHCENKTKLRAEKKKKDPRADDGYNWLPPTQ